MSDDPVRTSLSKRLFRAAMTLPVLPEWLAGLTHSEGTIFMAHRFHTPESGVAGHGPESLRKVLEQLRKRHYDLISVGEMFRRLREHESLGRAVAFTIDDGYHDVGEVAAPIFSCFDCPATVFTITDFMDGKIWLWWDKIAYIFAKTKRKELAVRIGKEHFHLQVEGDTVWPELVGRCYQASEEDRLACIDDLSAVAEVDLPLRPPDRYRSLSWDDARRLESKGISFGPHTVTHPVLATISAERSEREITGSWEKLRAELNRPVPIFCYPGGEQTNFGAREKATIGRLGLWGAVTGLPGNIRSETFEDSTDRFYRMPRFLYHDSLAGVMQCVSGMEELKGNVRRKLTTRVQINR
jgi:peptidoglycan/xylan/chitin deacetylase (PgdA/CDA1 family)